MQEGSTVKSFHITFRQRGGIVGGKWSAEINAAQLPREEAAELARLVEQADFFALPRDWLRLSSPVAVDYFEYDITVVLGERRRRVRTDDISMPASLRPLVSRLSGFL